MSDKAISMVLDLYQHVRETIRWKDIGTYTAVFAATWCIYKLFMKPFLSPLRKIPGPPYRPIVGNMFDALKQEAMTNSIRWMKKYKSRLIRFYHLFGRERLIVGDPEIVRYISNTNSKNYGRIGSLQSLDLGNFLLAMDGEEHHALRKLMNPAFNIGAVDDFVSSFSKYAMKMASMWDKQLGEGKTTVVEAQMYMARMTLDVMCDVGFGYQIKALEDPESAGFLSFKRILKFTRIRLTNMIPFYRSLPLKENIQRKKDRVFFKSVINNVIQEKKRKIKENLDSSSSEMHDLLSIILQARDENGQPLEESTVFSQVAGFIFAGFETTSQGLTWTLLNLARYPEFQERARQEVLSVMSSPDSPVTPDDIAKMPYLTCFIKESLRMFPPAVIFWRKARKDDKLNGYFIPGGTIIGISIGALHRLPENWDDPETFNPDRFMEPVNPYKFIPFAAGPYQCIGNRFSMAEMKTTLAVLLRQFRFEMVPDYTYRRVLYLTMQPEPPLILKISRVTDA